MPLIFAPTPACGYRARSFILLSAALIGACLAPQTLHAADAASVSIEQVVVTARKRTEELSDVPQAIAVFSDEDLSRFGYTTSPEIARQTPNLMWHSILGFATPQIFLRGIGNTTFNANQANPVGIHFDGIYQGSSVTYGFGLLDLDRVEILKGPQGTLFGRNTTGGVINFMPRKPDPAAGTNAEITATYGRYDEANLEGAAGFALSDKAAVRVAALTLNRDGYTRNSNPGSGIGSQGKIKLWSTRGQFRVTNLDGFDVLLNVHGGQNHSDVIPGKQVGLVCPAGVAIPRIGLCSDFLGFTDSTDLQQSFTNIPSFDNVDTWGTGATLTWQGTGISVVSQTAYDENRRRLANDSDAAPSSSLKTNVVSRYHQFSQEVRMLSAPGQTLTWIAGGNYYSDRLEAFQNFALNDFGPGALSHFFPVEEGIASFLDQQTESYAFFGEANYKFAPRLTLTAGLRWTNDRRIAGTHAYLFNATGLSTAFIDEPTADARLLAPTIPALVQDRSWSEWSGRGILSYDITDGLLVYGGVARGFKGGDFNGGALFAPAEANIVDPEFVTSYEIGLKGSTPGRKLTFDAAAFYYDFTNQQVAMLIPGSNASLQSLSNAAKTRVIGLEANVAAVPFENVYVELKGGWLDAEFRHFQLDPTNPATDFSGNRTASAPKLSLAGTALYTVPLGAQALVLGADFSYTGAHFFTPDNNPVLRENGYWLLNSSISFEGANKRYTVTAWVKNVTNTRYFVSGIDNKAFGFMELFPGLPRTFGITAKAQF